MVDLSWLLEIGKVAPYLIPSVLLAAMVVYLWRESRSERETREEQWAAERVQRDQESREERAKRDTEWQQFLSTQNAGMLKAIDAVAVNLQELSKQVAAVNARTERMMDILEDHDRHAERVDASMAALAARNTPGSYL